MTTGAPVRILVLCTGNSARSQIAEALLGQHGAGRIHAESAGARPAPCVHPEAIRVLGAHGIAWDGRVPTALDALVGADYDLVITVCDHARDACPVLPGAATVHWGLPDPAHAGPPETVRAAFDAAHAALDDRVRALVALPLETLSPAALAAQAAEIHRLAQARELTRRP